MLQQQGLLLSILANQSKMEAKQSEFEEKLLALEEKLSSSISEPSPSSGETKLRKCIVTAALTVSIIYNLVKQYSINLQNLVSLTHSGSTLNFKPEERYIKNIDFYNHFTALLIF